MPKITERSSDLELFKYPRPELASTLASEMLGQKAFGGFAPLPVSGTFLSAPRRVGKSTFLQKDLMPLLQAQGHLVVYVDLWSDKSIDPARILRLALYAALEQTAGRIAKASKALGLSKITALSVASFEFNAAKKLDDAPLVKLLTQLADKSKTKQVVLMVDEAQHALVSEAGENALYGLKSARDSLNANPAKPRLILLCTGSSRSKLSALVTGKQSPFMGAVVRDFPPLGKDFTAAYAEFLNQRLRPAHRIKPTAMQTAFELLNNRPESLFNAAALAITRVVMVAKPATKENSSDALVLQAQLLKTNDNQEFEDQFNALPITQQAVLLHLLAALHHGDSFAPFGKAALEAYQAHTGAKVTATSAQSALDGLVQKDIVWQARRGNYSVDDPLWDQWWAGFAKERI
jgi:hypothetical protein